MKKYPLKNYPGYFITKSGEIYSRRRRGFLKKIRPNLGSNGYFRISLYPGNKLQSLHRLLAETFIPNPKSRRCVNHIDGNKLNNDLINLEWVTYSENHHHAYRIGLKEYSDKSGVPRRAVLQYDLEGNFIAEYKSISEANRSTSTSAGNICQCCKSKLKTAGGYKWKYKEKEND